MEQPAYSIVVPAYNEGRRIGASLEKILAFIAEMKWAAEIIVVNDGSRDNTAAVVQGYAQRNCGLRLIENPGNRGKGYSVRNGMSQAHGSLLLFTDADLSAPIYEATKLFAAIQEGNDVAIGSRWVDPKLQKRKQPLHRQLFGRIFNLLLRIVLRLKFHDTQCGFKAFTRQAAESIFPDQQIERWGFDPELLYLGRHRGFKIVEVPVEWSHSEGGQIHPVRDGIRMFGDVLRIRWKALTRGYVRKAQGTEETS